MRLHRSLLLVSAAAAAPLLVFALIAAAIVFNQESSSLIDAARGRNRATLTAVDAQLEGAAGVLRALAAAKSLKVDDLEAFHRDANAVLVTQPAWQNVVLQAPDGAQLVNARLAYGTPLPQTPIETASLQAVVRTGNPSVSNVTFAPRLNGEPGIAIRVAVRTEARVSHVLTAVLDPSVFQRTLADGLPPGWISGLVGTDGRVIARVPPVPVGTLASTEFRARVAGSRDGWYRGKSIESLDVFTAFSTSDLTGWTIGYAIPADVILGGAKRAAMLMGAGLLLSVVSATLIAFWLSRRIARPMAALADAARQLGDGQPPPRVESGIDEVARLSHAVDGAAQLIQQRDLALRQQAAKLQEADTNKSNFLALLSHELRNPLAPLRTGAKLLGVVKDPAKIDEIRGMMDRQIALMARLIEDLVDVGRIDRGQLELRRVRTTVDDVIRLAVETSMPGIDAKYQTLSVDLPPGELVVQADVMRLGQVISNLLNNASRYTPPGGRIELAAKQDGGEVVISVVDTGVGFDSDQATRIFDLFVRLDESRQHHASGLGIGLTLARSLMDAHGGSITGASDGPDRGATFTLRLPLMDPAAPEDVEVKPPTRVMHVGRRVLVADDNVDAADALCEVLRAEGFSVHASYDGHQAVAAARAFDPDVAFLDLDMPGLSGVEVGRVLRAEGRPGRPVLIALTGLTQQFNADQTRDAGFDEYLTKPADPAELIRLAREPTASPLPRHGN